MGGEDGEGTREEETEVLAVGGGVPGEGLEDMVSARRSWL